MLGLPTETDEDVLGIAELVYKIYNTWKDYASNKKRGVRIHVAVAFRQFSNLFARSGAGGMLGGKRKKNCFSNTDNGRPVFH